MVELAWHQSSLRVIVSQRMLTRGVLVGRGERCEVHAPVQSLSRVHVVLLDVWATWCDPCRESLPLYQSLAGKYADKGLRIYAVNVDGEAAVPAEIPKFITETKLSLPILLDTDAKLSESLLKVKMMPTALLIDRKGRVRHVHEGFEKKDFDGVVAQLETLLGEN